MEYRKYVLPVLGIIAFGAGLFFYKLRSSENLSNNTSNSLLYFVSNDICGEFPKEWIVSVIHTPIFKTEQPGQGVCQYYIDERSFVTIRRNELSFENQKNGQQNLGRSIVTNPKIPINHFIAMQGGGVINEIVLEISPNVFVAVDRSSTNAANETEIIEFATQVALRIQKKENQMPSKTSEAKIAPLPQERDIVQNFFSLIDEGKASDAVMMMTSNTTGNDSIKQGFGVQFAAMNSVKVKNIDESSKADWKDNWHQYMVTLEVVMDPKSADGPIPYYGYEKGENIRFITLVKEGAQWKIEGVSTGP